jgi:phi LC3 family holin
MINWKVRLRNRHFIVAFISQIILMFQFLFVGLKSIGVTDFEITEEVKNGVFTVVNAILFMLSMLGIVQDPTTKGFGDSDQALQYKKPT